MVARQTVLIDVGDLSAPKGSTPWVKAVHQHAKSALNDAATTKEHVLTWVNGLRENNYFRLLTNEQGEQFMLWEDFCTTRQPRGLGYSPEAIDSIIEERKSIDAQAASMAGKLIKDVGPATDEEISNVDNINIRDFGGGTSAKYLTARIARDRPDILERMKAGEFKSVRAAAKEAGIVRDPTPLEILRRAWAKASPAEREDFIGWARGHQWEK